MSESCASDERYTPQSLLNVVRGVFGTIDLDPCAPEHNSVGAAVFRTKAQGGLSPKWHELVAGCPGKVVWVNPPYSRNNLMPWTHRCWRAQQEHPALHVLALLPGDTGTRAGQFAIQTAAAACFVKGRIKFDAPDRSFDASAKTSSIIYYWGLESFCFVERMSALGSCAVLLTHKEKVQC